MPEDSALDMSSPASTDENVGLFMLRKDSERRATLHRVLTDDMADVVANIQEALPQVRQCQRTSSQKGESKSSLFQNKRNPTCFVRCIRAMFLCATR